MYPWLYISLRITYLLYGIDGVSLRLSNIPKRHLAPLLRSFGAKIGDRANLSAGIILDNAIVTNDYSNLRIANDCYIGRCDLFDLVESISIGESCSISAQVTFLTHSDPGRMPLRKYYPRKTGGITIGKGTWIGAGSIILPGVNIGEACVIGAGAVVNKDIPPFSVAVGVPVRVIKRLK